jgi:two-component system, NtrC family, sensor kinase
MVETRSGTPPIVSRGNTSRKRGSVARRVLISFTLVLIALSLTMAWSVYAQRRTAQEAWLLRKGYVPLLLSLGTALETQNLVSAQLNHITDAKNPADTRGWIETQRRLRPLSFARVRNAATRGLGTQDDERALALQSEIIKQIQEIEKYLDEDGAKLNELFVALERGNQQAAEKLRNELVDHETKGARKLRALANRIIRAMDELSKEASLREQRAIQLLLFLTLGTLIVGLATAIYTQRVLAPLALVTDRAKAVAQGDLTARPVVASPDEIGELATTFENMVAAIGKARSELVQAERLAAVGRMAAHVTHEIRNPISSMGLNVELLEEELAMLENTEESQQLVAAIHGEIDRLAALSEQYLRLARRPTPELSVGSLATLVQSVVQFVRLELERANIEVRTSYAEGVPNVWFDEGQLRQALLNLIRNAREAMPQGGVLTLAVQEAEPDWVEVVIEDSGEGIPEEVLQSLFDPFFTTKAGGTGLGLAVTKELIEAHQGTILCETQKSGGTRFRIRLLKTREPMASFSSEFVLEDDEP